jgi:hypothetical protein
MLKQGLRIWRILLRLGIQYFGDSGSGLGDRCHIADGKKKRQNLPAVAYRAKPLGQTIGISRTAQSDMPTVGPTIARSATVSKLDAKS